MISKCVELVLLAYACLFAVTVEGAADDSCITASLSNVLGLGECLGKGGDLCTSNDNGAVETVTKLVECVLEGIVDLEPGAQVYIILQILEEALQRNGLLSVLLTPIMNICNSVSLDCSLLNLDTTTICGDLFVISLPSALNFGQCEGNSTQICQAGEVVTGDVLEDLSGFLTCMLGNLTSQDLRKVFQGTICSILNILAKVLGGQVISGVIARTVGGIFGASCSVS
ncbi:uncharacterized protein ISCGN_021154 [Ixodes scapularis]